MASIGDRVLQALEQVSPRPMQRELAERTGMTPDAFSRALHGQRQFAAIEIALLAEEIGADVHWLITGQPDPNQLSVAARHYFDHTTGQRTIPGRARDEQVLADIALAYRQAYPSPAAQENSPPWPASPAVMRECLGADFVRTFADRVEERLGVDVVRAGELSTAYSLRIGGRSVIGVPATGNWFRENWDLAHELGHLAKGHHDDGISEHESDEHEAAANAFAADLLLPAPDLQQVPWQSITDDDLAALVWGWGISTDALCNRLSAIRREVPDIVARWARYTTQRLLRYHLHIASDVDEITDRMDAAAQRRFPRSLQEAHLEQIASGAISKATLAWMLAIDADALEVDAPVIPVVGADELAAALGL
jgi:Zn-dependent peptidase ImmA (M78 family)